MNRLSQKHLTNLDFDRKNLKASILHFGPGAFHRAHQGYYFNLLNAIKPEFGIVEIALNSESTIKSLKEQDNLYSITELGINGKTHIIGAIKDSYFAPFARDKIFELLINPEIKIVTSTITEKGYCLKNDGTLDLGNEGIKHDIITQNAPQTYIGYVAYGLLQRYKAGIAPFIILPCDNLSDNGKKVKNALVDFAKMIAPDFAQYLVKNLISPSTMVDSITPKSDKILFDKVETEQGFSDKAAVWREEFTQWVIETYPGHENVPWQQVGVTLTPDVASYEQVKLRILNGAHSTLAYVGWCLEFETVSQAMANPIIEKLIHNLIFENIIPSLHEVDNIDIAEYANDIIARFKNPIVQHKLTQIAWDGSQKIGFRLLPSIQQNLKNGHDISYLCLGIAGWVRFIIKMTRQNQEITDPMAKTLSTLAENTKDDENDITGFLALNEIFESDLQQNPLFIKTIKEQYLEIIKTEIGGKIENL